jgi:hypothetical protein
VLIFAVGIDEVFRHTFRTFIRRRVGRRRPIDGPAARKET